MSIEITPILEAGNPPRRDIKPLQPLGGPVWIQVTALVALVAGAFYWLWRRGRRRNLGTAEPVAPLSGPFDAAGSDVQNVKTSARRDGDHWVLDDIKSFITLGGDCDTMTVLARTDPSQGRHGMHFFAVDRDTPGVQTSQIKAYANRPVPTYRVMLDNVRVPEERRLAAGFGAIMAGFNRERVVVAARWLGHMQTALAWAIDYAKVRQQFGKPIGANQSIAFKLAQGHVDVQAARHLTYHAARWDSGPPARWKLPR